MAFTTERANMRSTLKSLRRNLFGISTVCLTAALALAAGALVHRAPAAPPPSAKGMATEWPQYRGPESDGVTQETIKPWTGDLKQLWKTPVGDAFGSFAVANGKACLFAKHGADQEACFCYDAATGKQLWSTDIDQTSHDHQGGEGPRTTPAISGDRVYLYSTFLKLVCLNAADGKIVWKHDIDSEYRGQSGTQGIKKWGNAISPLLEGNKIIVAGGGAGATYLAFDAKTGKLLWKSGSDKITHASPTPATILGQRQIIFFMMDGLVSIDPASGRELWRQPFKWNVSTAASPVVGGNIVYCSAGYGVGGGAYEIAKTGAKWAAKTLWETPGKNINHWTTAVYHDGYLYGLYGFKQFRTEPLKCVNIKTGEEVWSKDGFGQGGLILAGEDLLIQGDQGQLVLVAAKSDGYHELARAQPLAGKAWQMAVVAEGKIFARTTGNGEAVCLECAKDATADAGAQLRK